MKSQKLIVSVAIACLLFGAPGVAMALDTCEGGVIEPPEGEETITVDEIILDGEDCFVKDVIVTGDVIVSNSEDFNLIDCEVKGNVKVTSSRAVIILGNSVGIAGGGEEGEGEEGEGENGDLTVANNERVWLLANINTGSTRVIRNLIAVVKANAATFNLLCRRNVRLDEARNRAGAEEECTNEAARF